MLTPLTQTRRQSPTWMRFVARRCRRGSLRPEPPLPHTRHSSSGHAGVVLGRRGGRRRRPHPQVVHGMPIQPLEGRIPARQRLGRHGRRWCDRPRPQLVCGLPVRPVEGRTPRQRRRGRISAPDAADGRRYSNDSRRGRLPPRLCLVPASCSANSLERSPQSFLGDASIVCPLLTK